MSNRKLTEEVKVRLLLQFPLDQDKGCCLLLFHQLAQVKIQSRCSKDTIFLIMPADTEIMSSHRVSASQSSSLKQGPLPETHILSLQTHSSLTSDALRSNISKNKQMHPSDNVKGHLLKTIENTVFPKVGRRQQLLFGNKNFRTR